MEGDYGGVNNIEWSNCNIQEVIYEDVFSFPFQLHPIDFRVETSGYYGFSGLDNNFQTDQFGNQNNSNVVDDVPMAEMFLNDPFYSSPHIPAQNNNYTSVPAFADISCCDSGGVSSGFWDHEIKTGFVSKLDQENQLVLLDNKNNTSSWALVGNEEMPVINNESKKLGKRPREVKHSSMMSSTKALSRETVSQYFYMPITQAARELNVGLTLLKKRCRDLGIRRWPHRKLISLQTLIKNVEESENERSSGEGKLNEYLRILEQEKKLLEEIPDMQLEVATKKLRQSFFKANYKKRKLMGLVDSHSNKSEPYTNHTSDSTAILEGGYEEEEEEDEEIKCFLDDCFSCN